MTALASPSLGDFRTWMRPQADFNKGSEMRDPGTEVCWAPSATPHSSREILAGLVIVKIVGFNTLSLDYSS